MGPTVSRVRRIDTAGVITTIAGKANGTVSEGVPAVDASLQDMRGVAVDGRRQRARP
jgi:hypothetical protein